MLKPYHSACFIVVQVGEVAQISAPLTRVHKLTAEHPTKLHVVTAAPPMPVWPTGTSTTIIACTRLNGALWAGSGHSMGHSCAGNGKYKCRLTATWMNKTDISNLIGVQPFRVGLANFCPKHIYRQSLWTCSWDAIGSRKKLSKYCLLRKTKEAHHDWQFCQKLPGCGWSGSSSGGCGTATCTPLWQRAAQRQWRARCQDSAELVDAGDDSVERGLGPGPTAHSWNW